ncbi:MAG: type pilus biosis/stability protein PilW [Polaromonas sp.]|nr:type pilus biosis/stability protein PilW [Polaromonas sp.]
MKFLSNAAWISLCWGAVLLAGCTHQQGVSTPGSGRSDMVTESDEPDLRRRARLRLELASGYFEQGQTNVALDELKQALVLDPGFADAYNLRGLVYMRLNDIPLAEDSFRRALALNPRDADVAHNYGWLLCQQARYPESTRFFAQAVSNPTYTGQAKSLMAQGVCQVRAGQRAEAEQSFLRSYQIDAGNPLTGYNLANLLYERGELTRAQFYIRRLNNSELANAETLWLGIKIEQKLNNREVVAQLGDQLKKRYGQSREAGAYEKGAFNE